MKLQLLRQEDDAGAGGVNKSLYFLLIVRFLNLASLITSSNTGRSSELASVFDLSYSIICRSINFDGVSLLTVSIYC